MRNAGEVPRTINPICKKCHLAHTATSCIAFAQAVQAALHPGPITSRAEAWVDKHRVVERRPLDRGAAPAEPARVGSLPLAGTTRRCEFPLATVQIGQNKGHGYPRRVCAFRSGHKGSTTLSSGSAQLGGQTSQA